MDSFAGRTRSVIRKTQADLFEREKLSFIEPRCIFRPGAMGRILSNFANRTDFIIEKTQIDLFECKILIEEELNFIGPE